MSRFGPVVAGHLAWGEKRVIFLSESTKIIQRGSCPVRTANLKYIGHFLKNIIDAAAAAAFAVYILNLHKRRCIAHTQPSIQPASQCALSHNLRSSLSLPPSLSPSVSLLLFIQLNGQRFIPRKMCKQTKSFVRSFVCFSYLFSASILRVVQRSTFAYNKERW